jgi:hypothetical protein
MPPIPLLLLVLQVETHSQTFLPGASPSNGLFPGSEGRCMQTSPWAHSAVVVQSVAGMQVVPSSESGSQMKPGPQSPSPLHWPRAKLQLGV